MTLTAPLAHNMVVALGRRDGVNGLLYGLWQQGRPVMDLVARSLLADSSEGGAQTETGPGDAATDDTAAEGAPVKGQTPRQESKGVGGEGNGGSIKTSEI